MIDVVRTGGVVRQHCRIVNVYPHDPDAFTQGLVFHDGSLFESTGLYGHSTVRRVRLETGEVLQQHRLDAQYFGEGLAACGGRLVQLTWRSNLGFVYDAATLAIVRTFTYAGEGWGLAADDARLVMSDGSPVLRFLDRETLRETGRLTVTDGARPVSGLNDLELVEGQVLANVWQTEDLVMIEPRRGHVTGRWCLRGLLSDDDRCVHRPDVLNGIAYDRATKRLFVTGKGWPKLFEIAL